MRPNLLPPAALRGLAILAVLVHHVCGNLMGKLEQYSPAWQWAALINSSVRWNVPLFIVVSTAVLALSYRYQPTLDYLQKRINSLVWPYLVWSVLYGALLVIVMDVSQPLEVWINDIMWGKTYFHLYFMVVLIQLALVVPLVARLEGWWLFVMGTFLQAAIIDFNRTEWQAQYPGSRIFWYLPFVALGVWLSFNPTFVHQLWVRILAVATGLALWGGYVWVNMAQFNGERISSPVQQFWYFAGGVSISAILWFYINQRPHLSDSNHWLVRLGDFSLQIYLLHPLVMQTLDYLHVYKHLPSFLGAILYFVMALGVPIAVSVAFKKLKLHHIFFGR